jgi:hypothetical protein
MTNNDAWDWRVDQVRAAVQNNILLSHAFKVKKYIKLACLKPESPVSPKAKAHLKCVWREIIEPAL